MGKLIWFVSIIIFVDLLFITFWSGASGSLQSIIATWITDPTNFDGNLVTLAFQSLFSTIAIGATAAIVVSTISGAKTDTVLFAGFAAVVIFNIGKDLLAMFTIIKDINPLIAIVVMVPLIIMFGFVTVEWLKSRD